MKNESDVKVVIEQPESYDNEMPDAYSATGAKTSNNKGKKVISLLLIFVLSIGAAGAGIHGYKQIKNRIRETQAKERTTAIVSLYKDNYTCSLDETIYSTNNYDTKISDGSMLVEVLNEQGIKYCEILDQFYTNDGRNIAEVTVEITRDITVEPTLVLDEVKGTSVSYYTLPEGYILKDGKGYKQEKEIVTFVTEVRKDGDYTKVQVPGKPGTITSVQDVKTISTKSYDEIINTEFVCDVKDDYSSYKNNGLSEATYALIPKGN